MAVQAPAYPLSPTSFATESAFAEHLVELRKFAGARFSRLVLIAPQLDEADYQARKHHLGIVDFARDGVLLIPAQPMYASTSSFWLKHARPLWKSMREAVRTAGLVHADMSTDVRRPMTAMASFAAWRARKPVLFVVDIDFRMHATRFHKLGHWSTKKYLVNRAVLEPLKKLQLWFAARMYQLLLLKSASMVRDFGRGRPHVKNFYDTVHADKDILSAEEETQRLAWLRDPSVSLHLCYFGRLVEYKGIDRMIDAVNIARECGTASRLTIIGDGPMRPALEKQVADLKLTEQISFVAQVPYGAPLFERLSAAHASIAAPLIEDTPRAVFDSIARGLPLIAFDISYFRDLAEASGAIALATWPNASSLAEHIVKIDGNRERLAAMGAKGLAFARANTQQSWLDRRLQWTRHYALGDPIEDQDRDATRRSLSAS